MLPARCGLFGAKDSEFWLSKTPTGTAILMLSGLYTTLGAPAGPYSSLESVFIFGPRRDTHAAKHTFECRSRQSGQNNRASRLVRSTELCSVHLSHHYHVYHKQVSTISTFFTLPRLSRHVHRRATSSISAPPRQFTVNSAQSWEPGNGMPQSLDRHVANNRHCACMQQHSRISTNERRTHKRSLVDVNHPPSPTIIVQLRLQPCTLKVVFVDSEDLDIQSLRFSSRLCKTGRQTQPVGL